jgi:hypothetical protein
LGRGGEALRQPSIARACITKVGHLLKAGIAKVETAKSVVLIDQPRLHNGGHLAEPNANGRGFTNAVLAGCNCLKGLAPQVKRESKLKALN